MNCYWQIRKYGEDVLENKMGDEPNKLVKRAEAIIKVGLMQDLPIVFWLKDSSLIGL